MGHTHSHRRDMDLNTAYCDTLRRHKPLADTDLVDLVYKAHKGDQKAFNKIVKSNLRFVVNIATEYRNAGLSLDELVSEGNLGLIRAVEKFNPDLGYKFTTYAVWWIRQAIQKALWRHKQRIRRPLNHFEDNDQVRRTTDRLRQTLDREPSHEELASHLNMTIRRVQTALHTQQAPLSLDDDELNMHEWLANQTPDPHQHIETQESIHHVRAALKKLPAREAEILSLTFGLDNDAQSFSKVAQKLGISKERVRQLRNRALSQMRKHLQYFAPIFQDEQTTTAFNIVTQPKHAILETKNLARRVA